jgi:hypothetical protein
LNYYQIYRADIKVCNCRKDWKAWGTPQLIANPREYIMLLRAKMPQFLFKLQKTQENPQ